MIMMMMVIMIMMIMMINIMIIMMRMIMMKLAKTIIHNNGEYDDNSDVGDGSGRGGERHY